MVYHGLRERYDGLPWFKQQAIFSLQQHLQAKFPLQQHLQAIFQT